jgi:hypothetical protein
MERGVTDRRFIRVATAAFVEGRFFLLFFRRGNEESSALSSSVAAEVGDVNICLNACGIVEQACIEDYDVYVP